MDQHVPEVAKKQKDHIPTTHNLAYGQVKKEQREEGDGDCGYVICDPHSGTAAETLETTYEAIPT